MRRVVDHRQPSNSLSRGSLAKLFEAMRSAIAAAEREWKLTLHQQAPEFCALATASPDENQLSELLATLLNPRGSHGQGTAFLRQFTKRCGAFGKHLLDGVTVHRESHTFHIAQQTRRLDILVDGGSWGIGIENKPWAGEQPKQLQDYADDLEERYKGNFLLIRLAGRESEVKSLDPGVHQQLSAERKFVTWRYDPDLLGWLIDCQAHTAAPRVVSFLKDFHSYIVGEFISPINQRKAMEQKHLLPVLETAVRKEPAQLAVIAAVAEQFPVFRHKLVTQLFDEVEKEVLAKLPSGWRVARSGEDFVDTDWASFGFTHKQWLGRYWVRLESQPKYGTIALGIWHDLKTGPVARSTEVAAELKRLGWGKKSGGSWWEGLSPLREPFADWHTALGFAEVFNRHAELKDFLIEEFVKLCACFQKPLAKRAKELPPRRR